MIARNLSTLELTVLGMAWLRGPCTIYAIMKELSTSESTYYKSRAGTAYSVSNRLLKAKLLEPVSKAGDKDKLVRITDEGAAALREWLTPPLPLPDVAHSADLLRLRFFFLGVVEPETRLQFIDNAIENLEIFLARCESLIPENERIGDYFGVLATLSTLLETKARIEWLRLVREWVAEPMPPDGNWSETVIRRIKELELNRH